MRGIGLDLGHPLGDVRDDVDALQALVALGVDDVRRPVPVVGDHQHGPRLWSASPRLTPVGTRASTRAAMRQAEMERIGPFYRKTERDAARLKHAVRRSAQAASASAAIRRERPTRGRGRRAGAAVEQGVGRPCNTAAGARSNSGTAAIANAARAAKATPGRATVRARGERPERARRRWRSRMWAAARPRCRRRPGSRSKAPVTTGQATSITPAAAARSATAAAARRQREPTGSDAGGEQLALRRRLGVREGGGQPGRQRDGATPPSPRTSRRRRSAGRRRRRRARTATRPPERAPPGCGRRAARGSAARASPLPHHDSGGAQRSPPVVPRHADGLTVRDQDPRGRRQPPFVVGEDHQRLARAWRRAAAPARRSRPRRGR